MSRSEWFFSSNFLHLYNWSISHPSPLTNRKYRLLAVARWKERSLFRNKTEEGLKIAELAELVADGLPLPEERPTSFKHCDYMPLLPSAQKAMEGMWLQCVTPDEENTAADLFRDIVPYPKLNLKNLWNCPFCNGSTDTHWGDGKRRCAECSAIHSFPSWFTSQAASLALAAYRERVNGSLDPLRLTILADSLEEAGCEEEILLRSLRGWKVCPYCCGNGFTTHSYGESSNEMSGATVTQSCDKWRRITHPRYRGQWALDLLLDLEEL